LAEVQSIFRRSERFEINNSPFREIEVKQDRIVAKGESWTTFELLVSYIGAAWMQKARRFGGSLLAAGAVLLLSPFWMMILMSYAGFYISIMLMFLGVGLILIWMVVKRESILMFTPSTVFRFEGNAGFVDALWQAVSALQRFQ